MGPFTIYPAIDIKNGKCVRLSQGDFERETIYSEDPFAVAKDFANQGAEWIHIVDLDGARDGTKVNEKHILQISSELPVHVQVGGGIRSKADVAFYIERGVSRVVVGSLAISQPNVTKELVKDYSSKIAIGLDARDGYVATEGWLNNSHQRVIDVGKYFAESGVETFIFTDIAHDGMMNGPNIEAIAQLADVTGKNVIASGGVAQLADLQRLKQVSNVTGVIIGKALYTKQMTVRDAIDEVTERC
ncbi:1-(5-phosphoribosyl)-5-[(5-phosphoribosylamino)methylideneamino]imidazole-4-carboxamide isomerase [Pontibacillus litoralis]|uniref:1-(5-phosphoribosyl)-5-[(5-phosphoribosylamino)methylideneamino] imidazole-4-carboxamide isomerase n=1 Tax=Pontibacillus litoralis JSM 072002 TaxID=1385512 RepID=A0A0A5G4X6_9BACI|nr:1-(5-phosphoribosyl)-5-[(5-phosphoribosylamino)methylideneamino]imidazole-4-carboxamide isomerase [Pontibacillus litoralis]KGX86208.1 1-(5-phosphoribosyl)-5-[(5-phosphoribosylamino)methylideneamino] imidazole-4-carboxamide isomerase [Pontibacillus litoralis JSM 072002]